MCRGFRGNGVKVTTGVLAIVMAVSATTVRADGPTEEGSGTAGGSVARPNISSNFEKPNTKPSFLSIRVTWTWSGTLSESLLASSRPPNPAPSIRIFVVICAD